MTFSSTSTQVAAALGLTCLLALTACSTTLGEPMDPTAGSTAASGQRDASSIREDFYTEIAQITDEAGGEWTYLDGGPFSPDDRASFSPKSCAADDGPRQLLMMVISSPTDDGPAANAPRIQRCSTTSTDSWHVLLHVAADERQRSVPSKCRVPRLG